VPDFCRNLLEEYDLENRFSGKFIVLDGPDGCGKTTQCALLNAWLKKNGADVEAFRDPGDTDIGEKIRRILLDCQHDAMTTTTEILLYMAARTQLWAEYIAPALARNKCVLLDRWLSSTCAYQGFAGSFGIDKVISLAADCLERPWPDLTVILDVDLDTAQRRLSPQPDRMEAKSASYRQKVREGFLQLTTDRAHFNVVDARDDKETVHKRIIEVVEKMF